MDVAISGNNLYTTNAYAGIRQIGLSENTSIQVLNILDNPLSNSKYYELEIDSGLAYASSTNAYFQNPMLSIIDMDSSSPLTIASTPASGRIRDLEVCDGYAYVTLADNSHIEVFDVDPPSDLSSVNLVPLSSLAYDCSIQDKFLYVASENGLVVLDITHPETASIINEFGTDSSSSIDVFGKYAYLLTWDFTNRAILIIDIDDPFSITEVQVIPLGSDFTSTPVFNEWLIFSNGYLYFHPPDRNIQIADIWPIETAYVLPGNLFGTWSYSADISSNIFCGSKSTSGVVIFRLW